MSDTVADLWVVAGPVGAGKSAVADLLLKQIKPTPALLDKDTLYEPIGTSILLAAGRPAGEREGEWYDKHIKVYEYEGMTNTAREIRSKGCPVMLSGTFTTQIHDAGAWKAWVEQLGGGTVHLVWVNTDTETLRERLTKRNSPRDTEKLKNFDEFIARIKPGVSPSVPHMTIDNRKGAPALDKQVTELLVGFKEV